jgi:hypothetical protein
MKSVWGMLTSTLFIALIIGYLLGVVMPGPGNYIKAKIGL